ncbi:MAG: flagellin [Maritimibacter sp.]|nr:flagellin [Maritimibacter sp.]
MSSILTNTSAMVALQTLKGINSNLQKTQEEISTGKSVGSAKDNSAVWAISKVMEADVNGFKAISDSLSLGESTLAVGQKAAETVTDLLTQMKGKIVAAQEENVDRGKLQTDIEALRDQISSVVGAAQFNGLNLVSGTDDVNILSSLDRSSDGTVAASHITVARQDMSTSAGVYGNGGTDLSSNITINSTNSTIDSTAAAKELVLTYAQASSGTDAIDFSIGGNSVNVAWDTDAGTTIDNLADAINALGLTGVSATSDGSGGLTLTNTNSFTSSDVSWNTNGTNTFAVANAGNSADDVSATAGAGTATLVYRAEDIAMSTSAQVNEGDSYRISVNGSNYDYIAGKGETMEDVAKGLKTAIDGGAETGVTTQVKQDATTGAWTVQVDYDGTDTVAGNTMALAVNGEDGGTASGGMFGLDNIDVTTDAGASAALGNIETLIGNAIDAAAAFGSAAGRVETQNDFISGLTDSLKAGIGSLVDADMEAASARLQALQVQQQLGTQALSIANQAPQNILSLFQ